MKLKSDKTSTINVVSEQVRKLTAAFSIELPSQPTALELYAAVCICIDRMKSMQASLLIKANNAFEQLRGEERLPCDLLGGIRKVDVPVLRSSWVYPDAVLALKARLTDAQAKAQADKTAYQKPMTLDKTKHQLFRLIKT